MRCCDVSMQITLIGFFGKLWVSAYTILTVALMTVAGLFYWLMRVRRVRSAQQLHQQREGWY